ncbi:MAG: hypothetical protein KKH33_06990, partial [Alphaproteobacteria bacterium]|nr:hypothetical protein [Alphaproteobacteria bacterium]
TAASGTVSFTSGQTSKTISVTTINDTAVESTETMTVTLSGPGANTTITTATGTGTINDNDSPIQLTNSSYVVLPAHQSTYYCYVTNMPEWGIYMEQCYLASTNVSVYEYYGSGNAYFDPGYSNYPGGGLAVLPSYYGTGQ